ncbi:hypothetical protein [Sphingomonas sp.]|uniref:hypothetical protein n=1 Tax=Sphingomonas sp. TaxID=28214 RepID=UPI000DB75C1A|nr:hypothetical protein [Sphingomonas sp.]PZU10263.1 MAG: hypothetical protein DI605_06695 [Sphingomonas sp.]
MAFLAAAIGWIFLGTLQGALFLGLPILLIALACLALTRRLIGRGGRTGSAAACLIFASLPLVAVILWLGQAFVRFGFPDAFQGEILKIFPIIGIASAPLLMIGGLLLLTWHQWPERAA